MSLRLPLALAELLLGWVLLTSVGQHGDPWPVAGAIAVGTVAYLVGRGVPGPARPWVAGALGVGALAWVLTGSGPLGDVLGGPLGYANANAALAAQAGVALGLVGAAQDRRARWGALAGVVVALVVTALIGAVAATAGVVLVAVAVAAPGRVGLRVSVLLSAVVLAGASVLPFVVGAIGIDDLGVDVLTGRRVDLWTDGVDALPDRPVLGAGAREFPSVSPTAAGDSDTREAHAELLQRGVENGVPGLLLEAGVVLALAVGLGRRAWAGTGKTSPRTAAVGLAGLAALWANAGVDYVLAFPSVLALGCALSGLASDQPHWGRFVPRRTASSERRSSPT